MSIHKSHIRKYWFGVDEPSIIAETVLLMERDRLEQYKAALDMTLNHFQGVFSGLTGLLNGKKLSVIYSIGPAHIADCVNFLARGFGVRRFISTGSIGGLSVEMGDIIITNTCATQDAFSFTVNPKAVKLHKTLGYLVDITADKELHISDAVHQQTNQLFNCNIKYGKVFTVPAVSLEDAERLNTIKQEGYIAIDLETGAFLSACRHNSTEGMCIHWVTDLPLERSFYYQYDGNPEIIEKDKAKKHKQWLNMPRMILPLVNDLLVHE